MPLHSGKPVHVVLRAPPNCWAWGSPEVASLPPLSRATPTSPQRRVDGRGKYYEYTVEESEAIWLHSGPFGALPANQ